MIDYTNKLSTAERSKIINFGEKYPRGAALAAFFREIPSSRWYTNVPGSSEPARDFYHVHHRMAIFMRCSNTSKDLPFERSGSADPYPQGDVTLER